MEALRESVYFDINGNFVITEFTVVQYSESNKHIRKSFKVYIRLNNSVHKEVITPSVRKVISGIEFSSDFRLSPDARYPQSGLRE